MKTMHQKPAAPNEIALKIAIALASKPLPKPQIKQSSSVFAVPRTSPWAKVKG